MPVYIDNYSAPFGRMIMSHMIADTHDELIAMADKIGVARHWIQDASRYSEHFDVCLSKRALAIRHGAIPLSPKDLVRRMMAKRLPPSIADEPPAPPFPPISGITTYACPHPRRILATPTHAAPR